MQGLLAQRLPGGDFLNESIRRGQNKNRRSVMLAACDPPQCSDALGGDILTGRDPVIGQTVPGGQSDTFQPGRKKRQSGGNIRHPLAVAGDKHQWPCAAAIAGEFGQHQRLVAVRYAGQQLVGIIAGDTVQTLKVLMGHRLAGPVYIVKDYDLVEYRGFDGIRHNRFTRNPGKQIAVGIFHQHFQLIQVLLAQPGDFTVGKPAQYQIHFPRAAVPTAKQDFFPAVFKIRTVYAAATHFLSCYRTFANRRSYSCIFDACQQQDCLHRAILLGTLRLMRPSILNPLFAPLSSIDGIGPKLEKTLTRLLKGGEEAIAARIGDLLFHLPHAIVDRRNQPGIGHAAEGAIATFKVRVDRHQPPPRGNRRVPYRIYVHDETGEMALTFFHGQSSWLEKTLPVGEIRYVSGRVEWFNGRPSMVHPDHIVAEAEFDTLPLVEPVYPLTAGLSAKMLQKAVRSALAALPELTEWQDAPILQRHGWPPVRQALERIHKPRDVLDIDPLSPNWQRLAYDELLARQLALALVRKQMKRSAGKPRPASGRIARIILDALPFELTAGQKQAVDEILHDLARPERMLRLLQGDVGSGKTVVALLAMAACVESGAQAALMAPTEILARQHFTTLQPLCEAAGMHIEILTGREKGKARSSIYEAIATGETDIVIGTHAIFQSAVTFADLGLGIIDEQHRFGVHQRLALSAKGGDADILVMTATPIPRTLVLTYFGDMDVSKLSEKPAGRQRIQTNALPLERLDDVVARVGAAIADGRKAYWICPLVEESEEVPITAAEDRFKALKQAFGDQVGLVHGRLKAAEKEAAMLAFKEGQTRVLVATTVIEVGVDVPDATIMVIEHAERFGLAQLHQLRGRVGRGKEASACLLLYQAPLGEVARARIRIMRETEDGFVIAEEDLRLRGEGEILGTRQSGAPGFSIARMEVHGALLDMARDEARLILNRDDLQTGPRREALRVLLYLHGQDEAVRLIRAG